MKTLSYISAGLLLLVFFISGCQDIFTYGPLDFLQRDPSTLSKDQQLLYARQALSSGKRSAMEDALDVVVNDLLPDDPTNPELYILAADLMWRLSYVPEAVQSYLFANGQQFPGVADYGIFTTSINSYLISAGTDSTLIIAAAILYDAVNTSGVPLNGVQDLATGIGLYLSGDLANGAAYLTAAINILVPVP
jgi:hypothetical protein